MTTLSDYISHGQGPEYRCSMESHAVKVSLLFSYQVHVDTDVILG
jgi:hypothetical protein